MSTVFTCENNLGAMLSCIYDASASHLGHNNIRLEFEPVEDMSFFDTYIHVDSDDAKINSVISAICNRISPYFYHEIAYCSGAYEKDVMDTIYRVLILAFHYGKDILSMYQYKDVTRFLKISGRYGREANSFLEFVRFHQVGNVYVSHIEPKSRVLLPVANHFADRMPSEHWIIVDDVHMEAVVHPVNSPFYLKTLTNEEMNRILLTEEENDMFTDLWQTYFDNIAIKERANRQCQLTHFPQWKRKHVVEFR